MRVGKTKRGFEFIRHGTYLDNTKKATLVQQSSAISCSRPPNPPDAVQRPGSSYLWIGNGSEFHLDRDEVAELVGRLQRWLDTGSLRLS